ncbi:hypothetical protein POWCR01_000192100 [Plasmodium ovale]|uniref:PIR protein n=1 Tax=Plasmodium ovale TaxID=36330 RepID=A0A1C3KJT5_PLAOA|nr:hypothetical protein POWCR01_000192100 [Plasmodium ovale]
MKMSNTKYDTSDKHKCKVYQEYVKYIKELYDRNSEDYCCYYECLNPQCNHYMKCLDNDRSDLLNKLNEQIFKLEKKQRKQKND